MDMVETMHIHPFDKTNFVWGIKLNPGDRLAEGDYYAASNGRWREAPNPGAVIEKGCTTYWVRMS